MQNITHQISEIDKSEWRPFFDYQINQVESGYFISLYITDQSKICLEILKTGSGFSVDFASLFETIEDSLIYLENSKKLNEYEFKLFKDALITKRALI